MVDLQDLYNKINPAAWQADLTQATELLQEKEHRFLHDNKAGVKVFAETQLRNIDHLSAMFPEMNWKDERQYFFHLIEPD